MHKLKTITIKVFQSIVKNTLKNSRYLKEKKTVVFNSLESTASGKKKYIFLYLFFNYYY